MATIDYNIENVEFNFYEICNGCNCARVYVEKTPNLSSLAYPYMEDENVYVISCSHANACLRLNKLHNEEIIRNIKEEEAKIVDDIIKEENNE